MEISERLQYLFDLMDKSISFTPEEIMQLKAYVMIKQSKVESFIAIFEAEQEKVAQLDKEFETAIQPELEAARDEYLEKQAAEKTAKQQKVADAMKATMQKIKEEELQSKDDADEFLDSMLTE